MQAQGQRTPGSISLSQCKTEREIVDVAGLEYGTDAEQVPCIRCPLCYSGGKQGRFTKGQGLFTLRQSVSEHLKGQHHVEAARKRSEEAIVTTRSRKIGLTVGRLGLLNLKEGMSYAAFERQVLVAHLNGVDVGTLNHSRAFIAGLCHSMFVANQQRIVQFLKGTDRVTGQRPVFALTADKVTAECRCK